VRAVAVVVVNVLLFPFLPPTGCAGHSQVWGGGGWQHRTLASLLGFCFPKACSYELLSHELHPTCWRVSFDPFCT
jgi:hypothetical protein